MAYYTALIAAWNNATQPPPGVTGSALTGGMTTSQKIDTVNAWTVTGAVPTSITFTGVSLVNCINYTEFKNLTDSQQRNVLALCDVSGGLLGGSANTSFLPVGMILDYFVPSATITSGSYNNGTGVVTLTMSASIKFGPGGNIIVAGLTGTGAVSSLNGTFAPITPSSGTTVTYNAGAGLGASTITGGSVTPPTITALTAFAKTTTQTWCQTNGYPNAQNGGGGLTLIDATSAGLV